MQKLLLFFALMISAQILAESSRTPGAGNAKILSAANSILTNLKSTRYSHKTELDISAGRYFCDCSGLGRILLKQVAVESLKSLPIERGFLHPRAISFYSAFTNAAVPLQQRGWQQIASMSDAQPGDFIAWRRKKIEKGKSSGHVMIFLNKPVHENDGSYRAEIMDSSSSPHSDDSRGKSQTGIGTGTMWFTVDETGKPTGYRWSHRQKNPTEVPIAIGRIVFPSALNPPGSTSK